ncbi:MAG TPA: hypothetical protein VH643_25925 [Gemmataceae bacterium]
MLLKVMLKNNWVFVCEKGWVKQAQADPELNWAKAQALRTRGSKAQEKMTGTPTRGLPMALLCEKVIKRPLRFGIGIIRKEGGGVRVLP